MYTVNTFYEKRETKYEHAHHYTLNKPNLPTICYYIHIMSAKKTTKKTYKKTNTITPAKKKFAQEYAKTDNASEAVRRAYPSLKDKKKYVTVKATRLLANDSVNNEIERQKQMLEKLATQAVTRVQELIHSDNEQVATTNSWNTIRQVQGNPTSKTESTTLNIEAILDNE